MRLRRGTLEGPILATLPALSAPAEFRFACEGGALQVSISGGPWTGLGDPAGGTIDADFQQLGVTASPAPMAFPGDYASLNIQNAAIALNADTTFTAIGGPWTSVGIERGTAAADRVAGQLATGASRGKWRLSYELAITAVDAATFTTYAECFAVGGGALAYRLGRSINTLGAGASATFAASYDFDTEGPSGPNDEIRCNLGIFSDVVAPGADCTLLHASFMIERKA